MTTREVSVDEIIEAAEKDGFIHCRGKWWTSTYPSFEETPTGYIKWLTVGDIERPITTACILGQIAINLQVTDGDLEASLNQLRIKSTLWLERQGYNQEVGVGQAAIAYNDYTQLSYKEIAKKVRAWLEPHRDKTFTMQVYKTFAKRKNETDEEYLARVKAE